jgi:hypothetical protein
MLKEDGLKGQEHRDTACSVSLVGLGIKRGAGVCRC